MDNSNKHEKFLEDLKTLCSEYGWDIYADHSGGAVYGLMIGTPEFIGDIMNDNIDYSYYDVIECNEEPEILH